MPPNAETVSVTTRRATAQISVAAAPVVAKISRSELAKHYTPTDAWIAIDDDVYDLTDFLAEHPGGKSQLMAVAGEDGSALFHSLHPGWVRSTLMQRKIVGRLLPVHQDPQAMAALEIAPQFDYHDPFSTTLRDRVETEMKRRGDEPRNTPSMWVETIFIVVMYFFFGMLPSISVLAGYYEPLMVPTWVFVLAIVVGGPFGSLMGMNVMHSSNHGGMVGPNRPILSWVMEHSLDLVGGGSGRWKRSHNFAHHTYTNTPQDPDISFEPFFRLFEGNEKGWQYQGQGWYWPILSCINHCSWEIRDTVYMFKDMKRWHAQDVFGHFFFSGLHKVYSYVIPFACCGWPGVYGAVAVKCLASFFIVPIFLASHNSMDLTHLTREETTTGIRNNPEKKVSWCEWQVLTSQDFNAQSKVVNFMTGGLSHQIEHHLFPSIHHQHLPWIAKIVEDTCKEFDIPYTNQPSFLAAWRCTLSAFDHFGSPAENKMK